MLALLAFVMFCTPDKALVAVTHYADVDLRYERGQVAILAVHEGRFAKPTNLPRWRGRFLASVLKAKKPVADVSFDFPLVAAAESDDVGDDERKTADRLRKGVTSTTTVRVPWPEGADSILIWDSSSKKTVTAPLKP